MKVVLVVSIVTNLGLLAVFKYTGFVAENVNALARAARARRRVVLPVLHLVLPVGISFYTFKAMSYAIDVYRGDARPMRRFTDYMCFEAFFPDSRRGAHHSLRRARRADAGARAHARQVRPRRRLLRVRHGARRSCSPTRWGTSPTPRSPPARCTRYDAWFGLFGYAFQIYFDFSGYSDMAVGLALMMGFVLIQNFDSPYKSDSITDFWRRWHISLSTWLRDYLYIPLGGNRKGPRPHLREPDDRDAARRPVARRELELRPLGRHPRRHAGVRAGAGQAQPRTAACPAALRVAITFLIVCLSWVFFRAKTLEQAVAYFASLFGLVSRRRRGRRRGRRHLHAVPRRHVRSWPPSSSGRMPNTWAFTARLIARSRRGRLALLVLADRLMWTQTTNPFLYFQF